MIIKKYGNYAPQLHPSVRVAENAAIVGNVTMEKDLSVWYSAVVRAEQDSVTVGAGTNIQDNVVIHCDAGAPVKIGKNVIIGHGAIVHSCTIGDNCMIGMGAILLSGCKIGEGSIIGGGAVVSGNLEVPPNSLAVGLPAKVVKPVSQAQQAYMAQDSEEYIVLAKNGLESVGEE